MGADEPCHDVLSGIRKVQKVNWPGLTEVNDMAGMSLRSARPELWLLDWRPTWPPCDDLSGGGCALSFINKIFLAKRFPNHLK